MRAITRLHDTKCAGSKFLIKTTVAMGVASKRAAIMEFMKCVFHYVQPPQLGQKPRKVPTMRFVAHRPHKRSWVRERKALARWLSRLLESRPPATLILQARIFLVLFLFLKPSLIMRVRVSACLASIVRWQNTSSSMLISRTAAAVAGAI